MLEEAGVDHAVVTIDIRDPRRMDNGEFRSASPMGKVAVDRTRSGWGDFDLMIETLTAGLGTSEWVLGDRFTAADVMLGSSVMFLQRFGMLPASKALTGYSARCAARPAYERAFLLDGQAAD